LANYFGNIFPQRMTGRGKMTSGAPAGLAAASERRQGTTPARLNPNSEIELCIGRSAGFPVYGFWPLSSRQFPNGNAGLEAEARPAVPVNPQPGMSALPQLASAAPPAAS